MVKSILLKKEICLLKGSYFLSQYVHCKTCPLEESFSIVEIASSSFEPATYLLATILIMNLGARGIVATISLPSNAILTWEGQGKTSELPSSNVLSSSQ